MIEVKILADSIGSHNKRITSFLLKYPRFIHAEFMTHRVFSRNTSSSRARPIQSIINEAQLEPAMPIFWGKNQKGMQAVEELDQQGLIDAKTHWNKARISAIEQAKILNKIGLHKQLVNRLLEPFTHITVICTATEYGNFFNLRAHKDAMPEIQELAFQMLLLYEKNKPQLLSPGEWHLPFCDQQLPSILVSDLLKICTARCARVSYLNFDGNIEMARDFELHDRLMYSGHWSPFEHAAQCLDKAVQCANLIGWKQYRKFFQQENRLAFDANQLFKQGGRDYE